MRPWSLLQARHTVLATLFVINIVSFMDRMVMSVAIPSIAVDFRLTPLAMGVVLSAFFASYSLVQIPGGLLADRFGVRRVASAAMLWWSAFTAATGLAASMTQMLAIRFAFGLGEGVYPACAFKTIATWFPRRERATATGLLLACSALGTALSPLVVVPVMTMWGWRPVFWLLSLPGIAMALLFWLVVRDTPAASPRVSPEELAAIEADDAAAPGVPTAAPGLLPILRQPGLLQCAAVLFCFDLSYWGFTTWLPSYLVKARGFSLAQMGVAASLPAFAGIVGSVAGGWVSERWFRANRRLPILTAQLLSALLLCSAYTATSVWLLIVSQSLAGFTLAAFFSTFWALPMTAVPRAAMGTASGFINMAGQLAAFASPIVIGYLVGVADGGFGTTFAFLVLSLVVSAALVLTLPARPAA